MAKKILIVDDEPNIVKLLASRLMAHQYDVMMAYDGVQAIKKAREDKPDLIILDFKMPAGDGVTVFENLHVLGDTWLIPVIFITAYPSEEIRQKVLDMGAVDFLTKPFDAEELLDKVRKALGEKSE